VDECLWPFLMFSKTRHKTTAAVWEILESDECSEGIAKFELLGGCLDAVRWEEGKDNVTDDRDEAKDGQSSVDTMVRVNLALSNRIAGNSSYFRIFGVYLMETCYRKHRVF
jgi:U3 small nucleolar RNA-associated protein 10